MRHTLIRYSSALAAACLAALLTVACERSPSLTQTATPVGETPKANIPWDWTGIIGTGQSLAVGQNGSPIASTTQPYNNMKLSTGNLPWPIDPDNAELKLVPLVEPAGRRSSSYPSSWPTNIAGETPHSAMANEITALVQAQFKRDFISIHSEVGENGQGMPFIKKNPTQRGVNGHAYEASMVETKAITRLAKAAGKTFGVAAVTVTHGESDAGNAQYEAQLFQLWQDYNTDLAAITGQKQNILMIVSQQNSSADHSASMIAQWKSGVDHPKEFVCSGPKYQYASTDALHVLTDGYRQVGEKYAQVFYERVILGHDWQPLQPTKVTHDGKTLTVQFHVPVGPLVWDDEMSPPHAASAPWKNGKGFEVMAGNQRVTIDSVEIKGDSVVITCAADPGPNVRVSYALYADGNAKMTKPFNGFKYWGQLRDSDPFKGAETKKAQPNYALAFEMTAP